MTGRGITIGVNSIDPLHYGTDGSLMSCENDAKAIASLAEKKGFVVKTLLTKDAIRNSVISEIKRASNELTTGDIFLCYYSGHGGQLPDKNDDELEGYDQTWCLHDAQLVDDELYSLFAGFSDKVRILVISDSCHSGSVTKRAVFNPILDTNQTNISKDGIQYKFLPRKFVYETYEKNKDFYDEIINNINFRKAISEVKAPSLLLAACQDNQYARAGMDLSLYTDKFLKVWDDGKFEGTYDTFHYKVQNIIMLADQSPNYFPFGQNYANFESQTPFTI